MAHISTNIHLPEGLYTALKMRAAVQKTTMKQLIIRGIELLFKQSKNTKRPKENPLLKYAGKAKINLPHGSVEHDKYIYK